MRLHDADAYSFNPSGDIRNSEFYISVPNVTNEHVQVDEAGRFPYDYKYGRNEGEIQEYVKVVPFDRSNIDTDIVERLRASIPETFQLMVDFNERNPKTDHLSPNIRIQ